MCGPLSISELHQIPHLKYRVSHACLLHRIVCKDEPVRKQSTQSAAHSKHSIYAEWETFIGHHSQHTESEQFAPGEGGRGVDDGGSPL
jgi:hypothetical protein